MATVCQQTIQPCVLTMLRRAGEMDEANFADWLRAALRQR